MSKSILVIDTPSCCNECSLLWKDEYSDFCPVKCDKNKADIYDYTMFNRKPDWCPLKSIPEKYEIDKSKCSDPFYEFEFEYGYNQCIDKILGG